MKKFLIAVLMAVSFSAFADTIGGNFSVLEKNGGTYANAVELYGSKAYDANVDLTLKGVAKHNSDLDKDSIALEAGAKYKFIQEGARYTPWVQPALTYVNPIGRDAYLGYVVDGGVDFYAAKDIVFTPAVSYENSFSGRGVDEKYTYGLKAAYIITPNDTVYLRARRENSVGGYITDRFYAGYEYKF